MIRVAHRGLSGIFPENTMLAFEKAIEYNPEAMEIDVQMTKDGELIVFHDEEISRTTGCKGWVKDFTLAEIKALDAFDGKENFHGQRVPTLDEYFSLIADKDLVTFVELKNSFITYPGMEEKVLDCIKRHKIENKVVIYSANHYSVMNFEAMAPSIDICFPFDNWIFDYGEYCKKRNVTKTIPYHKAMTRDIIDDFHKNGVEVYPWTVDDPETMREMIEMGVDGLLTNRIDILTELLK